MGMSPEEGVAGAGAGRLTLNNWRVVGISQKIKTSPKQL
jgi:hypothetical protein